MANPQAENGHTDIAHEILDAIVKTRIPGEAMQVFLFVMRKTWGWHKKEDAISLGQISNATGMDRANVLRARKKLEKMNLLTVVKKDSSSPSTYRIQKDFDKWRVESKKTLGVKKDYRGVVKKDNRVESKKTPTKETITKETIQKKDILSVKPDGVSLSDVIELFKKYCTTMPVPRITKDRLTRFKASLRDHPDREYWTEVFQKAGVSDFLTGRNGSWTACAIDWFASNSNRTKVIEGNYANKGKTETKERLVIDELATAAFTRGSNEKNRSFP